MKIRKRYGFTKRKCKNVDISNIDFITKAINDCLKNKKKDRRDIQRLFQKYGDVDNLALQIQKEILNRDLQLEPIWYKRKYDQASQKWRNIGIQDVKNQIYDYIAVNGLSELQGRLGKYQCASIKGRGQLYCANAIYNHIQDRKIKYFIKLDIRKYYESIDQKLLVEWLERHVKNEALIWLIQTILGSFESGLSIGSYLSQYLGNLYLSDIYHMIEGIHKVRRNKAQKVVDFESFYMDDILIAGSNSRELIKAAQLIVTELAKRKLYVKPSWQCVKIDSLFIDMAGYRIYRDHKTIRRTTLKKIRRSYMRFDNSETKARRIISFYGNLKHSDSQKFCKKYKVYQKFKKAKEVVAYEDKKRQEVKSSSY